MYCFVLSTLKEGKQKGQSIFQNENNPLTIHVKRKIAIFSNYFVSFTHECETHQHPLYPNKYTK